eukprot:scaffold257028_cov39-Tisochrysis_lutea.AAC.1
MGRQPKKRTDLDMLRPLYDSDNKGNLNPSAELLSLASRLGVEYMVKAQHATGAETGQRIP